MKKNHALVLIAVIVSLAAFFCFSSYLYAKGLEDTNKEGIIYGPHHEFEVTAPDGWVIDNQAGISDGLHAVFYPEGGSWKESKTVMYANGVEKNGRNIKQFIEDDVKSFKDKTGEIKDGAPLSTEDGKKAYVKYFLKEENGNYEAIAYIDEKYVVVIIALSARNEQGFNRSYPAFKELVASYKFISDKIMERDTAAKTVFNIPADILKTAKTYSYSKDDIYQQYEKGVDQNYGPELQGYLNECAEKTKKHLQDFTIVLKVEKDGSVSVIYADRHNPTTDCMVPKMVHAMLPPPPFAPYYELIETKVQ